MRRVVTAVALLATLVLILATVLSSAPEQDASHAGASGTRSPADDSSGSGGSKGTGLSWRNAFGPSGNWTSHFKNAAPSWMPFSSSSAAKGAESYRDHLLATTSPEGFFTHSRTMGFSKIFVLSLPGAEERRQSMDKIARALELDFEFFDATPASYQALPWIAERVDETRQVKIHAVQTGQSSKFTVGRGDDSQIWLAGADELDVNLPELKRFDGLDWHQYLGKTSQERLKASSPPALDEAIDSTGQSSQSRGEALASWFSHVKLLKRIVELRLPSTLVLEDDVDMEMGIEREFALIRRRLPWDWDLAFLGHCWGQELDKPAYLHPRLHESSEPRCLHGYAVSLKGAERLLSLLSDPWKAYQVNIDEAIASLIKKGSLKSYSVEPPLIVQAGAFAKTGTKWRGMLADSTMDRILREEGLRLRDPVHDPENPAARLRTSVLHQANRVAGPHASQPQAHAHANGQDKMTNVAAVDNDVMEKNPVAKNPMAALPKAADTDSNAAGSGAHGARPAAGQNVQPAPAPPAEKPKEDDAASDKNDKKPKVGTGGKVKGQSGGSNAGGSSSGGKPKGKGVPAEHVQAEAGKRIGTGARPAAQGLAKPPARVLPMPAGDVGKVHVADANAHKENVVAGASNGKPGAVVDARSNKDAPDRKSKP